MHAHSEGLRRTRRRRSSADERPKLRCADASLSMRMSVSSTSVSSSSLSSSVVAADLRDQSLSILGRNLRIAYSEFHPSGT